MPIYEYMCHSCGYHFELRRALKDANTAAVCKNCFSSDTQKALSRVYAIGAGSSSNSGAGSSCSGGCGNCSSGSCGSCHH